MAPGGSRTLRKTACSTCVSAKRRCDSALPSCGRCTRMAATCRYPFPTAAPKAKTTATMTSTGGNRISASGATATPRRRPIAPLRRPPLDAGTGPVAASQFSAAGWLAAGGVANADAGIGMDMEMEMEMELSMGMDDIGGTGTAVDPGLVTAVDPGLVQDGTAAIGADMDWSQLASTWEAAALGVPAMDYTTMSNSGAADAAATAAPATVMTEPSLNAFYLSPVEDVNFNSTSESTSWNPTSSAATVTATPLMADSASSDNESSTTTSPAAATAEETVKHNNSENWSRYTRRTEKRQPPAVTYLAVRPPTLTHPAALSRSPMSNRPYWSRGGDTATWMFCAGELMSYVEGFARTGSTHFILPLPHVENFDASLVLHRALGVCAARDTLGDGGRDAFEGMLDAEVAQLVESSMSTEPSVVSAYSGSMDGAGMGSLVGGFRMELSRLQAMILYMTLRLFGPTERQRRLGEELEPLLAAWTRELLFKIRMLESQSQQGGTSWGSDRPVAADRPSGESASTEVVTRSGTFIQHHHQHQANDQLTAEEIQSAYRTVITSYMVRGVYAALVYQICHLVGEMATIPVVVSEPPSLGRDARVAHRRCLGVSDNMDGGTGTIGGDEGSGPGDSAGGTPGSHRMSYGRLAESWDAHAMAPITEYDPFTQLLIVACKGVGIIPSKS